MSSEPTCDADTCCNGTNFYKNNNQDGGTQAAVKEFYGKRVQKTADLKTGVCTLGGYRPHPYVKQVMDLVHPDVKNKFYGCGLVIPEHVDGATVLDLGSGAGFDCFVLSKLVGEHGHVTGIDMTTEQLDFARTYIDYHTKKYGFKAPNVNFVQGYIEDLSAAGIPPNHHDIIISNCVLCLCPDKKPVMEEAFKALKVGGEFYFSCIYADGKVPEKFFRDNDLLGEGYAGAQYWKEFYQCAKDIGFSSPRLVSSKTFNINDEKISAQLGDIRYVSATYRLFKLQPYEQRARVVVYKGTIPHSEDSFQLDQQLSFKKGEQMTVNSTVAAILESSRFAASFDFLEGISDTTDCEDVPPSPFDFSSKCCDVSNGNQQ